MPFAISTKVLSGALLSVTPNEGFGWHIGHRPEDIEFIEVPIPFEARMVDVLIDGSEVRAIIAQVNLKFGNREFIWASFIPRTDDFVDLGKRSIGCNILITSARPYIADEHPFPHPGHISAVALYPHVRGFGELSL